MPEVNCTEEQMLQVVEGHLTTEALMLNRDERTTIAGVTANKWQEMYEQELSKSIEHYDVNHKPEGTVFANPILLMSRSIKWKTNCSNLFRVVCQRILGSSVSLRCHLGRGTGLQSHFAGLEEQRYSH